MTEVDDPDDLAAEAKSLISAMGDEVDKRVNKILDERMRVDPKEDEPKEDDPKDEPKDDPPAPKSLAERLGF